MTTESLPPLPDEEDTILPPLEDAENLPPLPEDIPADTENSPLPLLPDDEADSLPPSPADEELPQPPPPMDPLAQEPAVVLPQPLAPAGENSASKLPLILATGLCLGGFIYMVSANSHSGSDSENVSPFSASIPTVSPDKAIEIVSPDKAIEMLIKYEIIDQFAAGALVTTQKFGHSGSHMGKSYKENPIKAHSEDLLRHFAMYKDGVEKITDYPYVDKIIELYRRANTKQEEMQAQGLAKMTDDLNKLKETMANALLGVDTPEPAPQIVKKLPVQCLKAFTAKGCKIKNFKECRSNVHKVNPFDKDLMTFIYSELCGTSKHLLNIPDMNSGMTPLMYATREIMMDQTTICEQLIKAGAKVNARDNKGRTALMMLLSSLPHLKTPSCINILLKASADINAKDDDGRTPFLTAVSHNMDTITFDFACQPLIDAGADINATDKNNYTALMIAASKGNSDTAKKLITLGQDVNAISTHGETPLMLAAEANPAWGVCEHLINAGANINARDEKGRTALMRAALTISGKKTFDYLIQAGADVNVQDNDGRTLLMQVYDDEVYGNMKKKLLDHYLKTNIRRIYDYTLEEAENLREILIDKLLQAGADSNLKDKKGYSMISRAINGYGEGLAHGWSDRREFNQKLLQKLLQAGCKIDPYDSVTQELFAKQYSRMSREMMCDLIQAGANVNAKDENGVTPLMRVCEGNDADTCQKLIQLGADINAQDNNGYTPLMYAFNNEEIIHLLLNKGADVNIVDKKGRKAADNERLRDNVRKLLQSSSRQDMYTPSDESYSSTTENRRGYSNAGTQTEEDRSGLDPLIANMRALRCREATSQLYQKRLLTLLPLIRNGADVNVTLTETKSNTALHYACGIGSWSITQWLVEHGADVNAVTNAGKTPLDCVGSDNAKRIRELLISRGAKRSSELSASSYTYSAGNDAEELNNLGLAYQYGNNGKPQNYSEAARHFRLAAEQGHAGAQNNLGFCYHNGWGVPKDMSQAAMWYRRSADQGNAWGQSNYGTCLEFGWGVRKNVSAAIEMYRRAAAQGHASAKKHLKRHGITM